MTRKISGLQTLNQNIHDDVVNAATADPNLTAKFVDLSGSSTGTNFGGTDIMAGHKWCSSDPGAYGGSVDYSQYPGGPYNPAPFHPTPAGQFAIYQQVLSVLNS